MPKLSMDKLDQLKNNSKGACENCIKVGMSTCGLAAGADKVYNTLADLLKEHKLTTTVEKCGCIGMCYAEPLVEVNIKGLPSTLYGNVTPGIAKMIIENHIINKELVNDYIYEINS